MLLIFPDLRVEIKHKCLTARSPSTAWYCVCVLFFLEVSPPPCQTRWLGVHRAQISIQSAAPPLPSPPSGEARDLLIVYQPGLRLRHFNQSFPIGQLPMALSRRSRFKDGSSRGPRRAFLLALVSVSAVLALTFLLKQRIKVGAVPSSSSPPSTSVGIGEDPILLKLDPSFKPELPKQNDLSLSLEERNRLPPRNTDLFPSLAKDHIKIVLYVHNRPKYLDIVVKSLSQVDGIGETLLVVSHDGYFPEMDNIIKGIRFCQVKQIFAPFSPHLFPDSFPGVSPGDCRDKDKKNCQGNTDQYGNHRSPRIVSLKHHWWWMMNTVWDSLPETHSFNGHILFIEEDHFIVPNAYRNLQLLVKLKPQKCPECYAANLAPSDVKSRGEGWESLIAERMGNIGYTFNRTVWRKIHAKAKEFCNFDEYNWDITMWSTVYPSFGKPVYTLRGSRASAVHFGKCGLHQGQDAASACVDDGELKFQVEETDQVCNINADWPVHFFRKQSGYQAGFKGWGGWGDERDRRLCLSFAYIYHQHHSPQ